MHKLSLGAEGESNTPIFLQGSLRQARGFSCQTVCLAIDFLQDMEKREFVQLLSEFCYSGED
jgi:hypothetical protein